MCYGAYDQEMERRNQALREQERQDRERERQQHTAEPASPPTDEQWSQQPTRKKRELVARMRAFFAG